MTLSLYSSFDTEIIIENVYAFYPTEGAEHGSYSVVTDRGVSIYENIFDFHVRLPE